MNDMARRLTTLLLAVAVLIAPTAASAATGTRGAAPTAAPATDQYWHASAALFNSSGHIADVYLWLDLDTGDVHAEVGSPIGEIQGSVIKLQTSGYIDFRNVPYSWSATVPANAWYTNTTDVRYNNFGNNWWWRACGYVGSGKACTDSWKFTYSVSVGWQETLGQPQTP